MKKKIDFIFLFSMIILNSGYSQSKPSEIQLDKIYERYADTVNIRFSARFLLHFKIPTLASFPFQSIEIQEGQKQDSSLLGKLSKLRNNYNIADTINKIKNYYLGEIKDESALFKGIDSLENYMDLRVQNTSRSKDTVAYEKVKKDLSDFFDNIYKKNEENIRGQPKKIDRDLNNLNTQIKELEEKLTKFSKPSNFLWIAFFTGIISFVVWIIFLISRIKTTDEKGISLNTKKYISNKMDLIKTSINDLSNTFRKIDDFESKITKLNESLEGLKNEIQKNQELKNDEQSKEIEFTVKPPRVVETYYLQFPDPNGFFWDEKKSRVQQNDTPYILEIDPDNPNKGDLSFISNKPELIRNAIASAKDFLKPVCTIQGNTFGDKIETIEKGKLERKNDKWQIMNDKKLVIRIYS